MDNKIDLKIRKIEKKIDRNKKMLYWLNNLNLGKQTVKAGKMASMSSSVIGALMILITYTSIISLTQLFKVCLIVLMILMILYLICDILIPLYLENRIINLEQELLRLKESQTNITH